MHCPPPTTTTITLLSSQSTHMVLIYMLYYMCIIYAWVAFIKICGKNEQKKPHNSHTSYIIIIIICIIYNIVPCKYLFVYTSGTRVAHIREKIRYHNIRVYSLYTSVVLCTQIIAYCCTWYCNNTVMLRRSFKFCVTRLCTSSIANFCN